MIKALPILLLFISTSAISQINLPKIPKIPNPFKKGDVSGLKVSWNCPQESYGQIAQLPENSEVTISLNEDGTVKYHPNIFKIKPLSKQFFQGLNPKKLFSKDKTTYRVDYSDCLDRFYSGVEKAHREYKKECTAGDKICDYDSRFFVKTSQKAVEESRYFEAKDNIVSIPSVLPGNESISLSNEEAMQILKDFCLDDKISNSGDLLSQKVGQVFKQGTNGYSTKFPGLVCAKKYTDYLNEEASKIKEDFCHEGGSNPICSKLETNSTKLLSAINEATERIKQVIAKEEKNLDFRYAKHATEEEVESHLKNEFKIPEENCSYSNHTMIDNKNVNLSYYDSALSKNLDKIFDTGSPECQRIFLQNYVSAKTGMLKDDGTLKNFCDLHATPYCEKVIGEKKIVEQNVERMIKALYGDLGERFYNEKVACEDESQDTLADILGKIKDSEKVLRCMDLKDGEFANISRRINYNVSTGDYTIKKLDGNKYEAYFHIEFQDNPAAKTTAKELMARAQSCMGDVSPFMKGPNGEQLSIKIVNEENGLKELPLNQRPKKTNIGIAAKGFRSHSKMYEENIDCPVITHEVLHLFGLCDEYKERWKGPGQNYDCRVVPKAISVMANQYEMFEIAVDKEVTCSCKEKTCKDVMNGSDEEKKKLLLSKTIYEIINYQDRAEYCSTSNLGNQKFEQLSEKDKGIVLTQASENQLVVEGREFIEDKIGYVSRVKYSCACDDNDSDCKTFLERAKEGISQSYNDVRASCPAGSRFQQSNIGNAARSQVNYDEASGEIKITQKAKAPSLLHPSHFERILGGACEDKGAKYLECAKFAYKDGDCEVPDYCKDDSQFLGIKQ